MSSEQPPASSSRIWDGSIRLFHVALMALFALSWYTAENMHVYSFGVGDGPSLFEMHVWSGSTILVLVLFRVIWGIVGSSSALFTSFVTGPREVWKYLRSLGQGQSSSFAGHNPAGGWSVLVMLVLFASQAIIGLMSSEDTFGLEGPLKHLVSQETSYWLAGIHHQLFNVILSVVALHILAVLYYLIVRKENLVTPMITGRTPRAGASGLRFQSPSRAVGCLLVAAAITWLAINSL